MSFQDTPEGCNLLSCRDHSGRLQAQHGSLNKALPKIHFIADLQTPDCCKRQMFALSRSHRGLSSQLLALDTFPAPFNCSLRPSPRLEFPWEHRTTFNPQLSPSSTFPGAQGSESPNSHTAPAGFSQTPQRSACLTLHRAPSLHSLCRCQTLVNRDTRLTAGFTLQNLHVLRE